MRRTDIPLVGSHHTLGAALGAVASQFPTRVAYREQGRAITFGEWIERADAVAFAMRAMGVAQGDVVMLHLPSSIDYAICYAATARLGAVASGLNTRLGSTEIAKILAIAEPRLIFCEDGVETDAPADVHLVARSQVDAWGATGRALDFVPGKADDPAAIIWTSGTTGTPKGTWFDHRSLAAAVDLAGPIAAPFDRRLVATPFAHAGYMSKLWEQAAFVITLVVAPSPWSAEGTASAIADNDITVVGAVPTQWSKLSTLPDPPIGPNSNMRLGVVATAPASADLIRRVKDRFGLSLVNRYAMTECPTAAGTEPDDDLDEAANTVGRPVPGVEIEIRDEVGRALPAGTIGRIFLRAPCQMRGYWNAPEATTAAIGADGWLHSGDLGCLDVNGRLVVSGRSTEMYIRGGYNVYPQEVEAHLVQHASVAEICVVGIPAPVIGEVGVAVVVPVNACSPPTLQDLRSWCHGAIADYKRPDHLVVVSSLPLTTMMKLDRKSLRKTIEGLQISRN